ncbi:zn-finger domain-containing protein [Gigaspora margarita]|uniref:Zn-finger domain-containing protein n=1 Tax=Gigaspora margarita TaxID=4874 RepID=A0A8H4EMS0_GIGMA|nr:zn-finger domain-containing protein [Gigaspora margarita]
MPLISCIENILKISDIAQNLEFEYKELYKTTEDGKEIIYKEQNNKIWWKTAQNSLLIGSKLLSIILYSDTTNCNTLVSIIIADWPEAATFCLTYKSTNSNNSCHFCLANKDNLANTTCSKHNLVLRNHKNMRNYLDKSKESQYV